MTDEPHKTIYLEPICPDCDPNSDGQMWCEDDVWSGKCEGCGHVDLVSTKYVLADNSHAELLETLEAAKRMLDDHDVSDVAFDKINTAIAAYKTKPQ